MNKFTIAILSLLIAIAPLSSSFAATDAITQHMTKSGKPDKRYDENKHLKKDGTPDMRYKTSKKASKSE